MRDSKGRFCKAKFKVGDVVDAVSSLGMTCRKGVIVKVDSNDYSFPYRVEAEWFGFMGKTYVGQLWSGEVRKPEFITANTVSTLIQQEIDRHAESARKAFAENDVVKGNAWAIRKDECEKILALVRGK